MSTLREIRESLVEISRRHSPVAHEVEDLAHDVILSALRRGFPLDGETFLRSTHGAARRHGAFLARSAGRRRVREARGAGEDVAGGNVDVADDVEGAPLSVLSPALRTTLLLLLLGLEKAELRLALGVTDAALRKRFQALREHGPLARPDLRDAFHAVLGVVGQGAP
jgi:DNA-directed RNA polymerase specialized sigma24 family protein